MYQKVQKVEEKCEYVNKKYSKLKNFGKCENSNKNVRMWTKKMKKHVKKRKTIKKCENVKKNVEKCKNA